MNNSYPLSSASDFEVMTIGPLAHFEQKLLLKLYMPIVGDKVVSLYQTLYALVEDGSFESNIEKHEKIIKLMHLRSLERFYDLRIKLEAIGLLEVYYKDGFYVYYLKKPLDVESFFNNLELSTLLEYQIGQKEYEKCYFELMMRKLDVNKFAKITHHFDEVYEIEASDNIYISQTTFNNLNNGIVVTNKDFDFNQFMILTSAHDIIKPEYFSDQTFIDAIKRYSFLYKLNPEQMKDVVILACNEKKEVDYEALRLAAKKLYDKKAEKLGVIPRNLTKPSSVSDNKLIKYLDTASPTDFVKNKSGVALISSEIEMFDRLLKDTGISVGVLNVLIGQVLTFDNLHGEIPSYNYFLKIINTWKRAGIKTTADAIAYVSKKSKVTKASNKVQKGVPDWYQGYLDDLNQTKENEKKLKNDTVDLEELRAFFKPTDKE